MKSSPNEHDMEPTPKTAWSHVRNHFNQARFNRPISFYLLLAMLAVLCLGAPMLRTIGDPKRFAFYLSLFFVFFLVVLCRAVYDLFEITQRHFKEKEKLYRTTLGEQEFVAQLSERIAAEKTKED